MNEDPQAPTAAIDHDSRRKSPQATRIKEVRSYADRLHTGDLATRKVWKSDKRVPYLVVYEPTGTYFARARIRGKTVRKSLGTTSFAEARIRLAEFFRAQEAAYEPQEGPTPAGVGARTPWVKKGAVTLLAASETYLSRLRKDHTQSPKSVRYREQCIDRLRRSWDGWNRDTLDRVGPDQVMDWAAVQAKEWAPITFNNTLATLRLVLDTAAELDGRGPAWRNPAKAVKNLGVQPRHLVLPTSSEFQRLLAWIDSHGEVAFEAACFIRLLSLCGLRISEAQSVHWGDFDFVTGELLVHGAKARKSSSSASLRRVPLIPEAEIWFRRAAEGKVPDNLVLSICDIRYWLRRATQDLHLRRWTHHDFRHLFATRCIESGVDIPTVARWLGHKDGGALAMRVYGHLRNEHSLQAAKRVSFGCPPPQNESTDQGRAF